MMTHQDRAWRAVAGASVALLLVGLSGCSQAPLQSPQTAPTPQLSAPAAQQTAAAPQQSPPPATAAAPAARSTSAANPAGATLAAQNSAAAGGLAPPFQLTNLLDGKTVRLLPDRPTVLYFMAVGCNDCTREEGALKQVWAKYGDQVQLVSVDVDTLSNKPADLKDFAASFGATWPHALDTDRLVDKYAVTALSTTVVINSKGQIVFRDDVSTPFSTLDRALTPLVTASQPGGV